MHRWLGRVCWFGPLLSDLDRVSLCLVGVGKTTELVREDEVELSVLFSVIVEVLFKVTTLRQN